MTRAELLKSPDYWKARIQISLYNCAESFMKRTRRNRKQLAEHLGVSSGYVTQLLNGDYDHKLSKLTELSLAFGYVPSIEFIPIEQYIVNEQGVCIANLPMASEYHLYNEKFGNKTCLRDMQPWEVTTNPKGAA